MNIDAMIGIIPEELLGSGYFSGSFVAGVGDMHVDQPEFVTGVSRSISTTHQHINHKSNIK